MRISGLVIITSRLVPPLSNEDDVRYILCYKKLARDKKSVCPEILSYAMIYRLSAVR